MGVSAVPGSGKTWTLSLLAAHLVAEGRLEDDQEVLIVTLVNAAVDNFSARIAGFLQDMGLLPGVGYRVRTLHGLAHDIVRERPDLVMLSEDFNIVDDRTSQEIIEQVTGAWMRAHPEVIDEFLSPDLTETKRREILRRYWPALMVKIVTAVIRQAKDLQMTPEDLHRRLESMPFPLPLLEMAGAVYADYQRSLVARHAVDFDDLIRMALLALQADPVFLERLRYRWPYILEDEAQDSSRLQEKILRELTGEDGHWVRVGDPNQAIYETFTTADPRYLRAFMNEPGVVPKTLPESGRSMRSIINLANYLITWTMTEHPLPELREALSEPFIQPVPSDDPQPNPPDAPEHIRLVAHGYSAADEVRVVAKYAAEWVEMHPQETVAILVPRNERGYRFVEELERRRVPYVEWLRSSPATRETAQTLANVLDYLSEPISSRKLAEAYRAWQHEALTDSENAREVRRLARQIEKCGEVESYLWPSPEQDWLASQARDEEALTPHDLDHLERFRELVRRWLGGVFLPIDQLVLTLAQDLFHEIVDLAVAHKLALALRSAADLHPEWALPDLVEELRRLAQDARRLGLGEDDTGFDPDAYPGRVVVTTMHKAKGLEWDKVYLVSVNSYDFPSGRSSDTYMSEPWYIRGQLNLQAEAVAQLKALHENPDLFIYDEGTPTLEARLDYAAERLRLLYVGITRAKRALSITWNRGKRGDQTPALALTALRSWWETRGAQVDGCDIQDEA